MSPSERVLVSTLRPLSQLYRDDGQDQDTAEVHRQAILAGTLLRSSSRDNRINRAEVYQYTDPADGSVRWAHTVQHLTDYDWADWPTQPAAVAAYEDRVRVLAATGWLYDETDVEGVATTVRMFCPGCGLETSVEYPACWNDACPGVVPATV